MLLRLNCELNHKNKKKSIKKSIKNYGSLFLGGYMRTSASQFTTSSAGNPHRSHHRFICFADAARHSPHRCSINRESTGKNPLQFRALLDCHFHFDTLRTYLSIYRWKRFGIVSCLIELKYVQTVFVAQSGCFFHSSGRGHTVNQKGQHSSLEPSKFHHTFCTETDSR